MKQSNGFTLIEVLIAAIILFSALALISDIFKGAMLSSSKAVTNAQYYQVSPSAISAIKTNLRNTVKGRNVKQAEGNVVLFGVNYTWFAERIAFGSAPEYDFDEFEERERFSLYQVQVNVEQGSKRRDFLFKVATW